MRVKIILSVVLLAVLALFVVLAINICSLGDEFSDEKLSPNEVRVNVRDGKTIIRWAECDADGYNVYCSESLYGSYFKVNQENIRANRFETEKHIYNYFKIAAVKNGEEELIGNPISAFGDETLIVAPNDDVTKVQSHIDDKHSRLESGSRGQFSDERFAIMLKAGDYANLSVKTGYYTNVMGLGQVPTDVKLGSLYVSDKVLANDNSTCTFWRGVENMSITADTAWKNTTVVRWSVSQATSMRRVNIIGDLALSTPSGWSSGGFLANSKVSGTVHSGTQQQWMSRNDDWAAWSGNSHNYVFSGCEGKTPSSAWSESTVRYTNIEHTEIMAEKPFLLCDEQGYKVFVPDVVENRKGVSWNEGFDEESGRLISLDDFYIASSQTDNSETMNAALGKGKHLLLTPGQYMLDTPLKVTNANTVVLGMGYATLKISDKNKDAGLRIGNASGIRIANILMDAGLYSKNMVVVGENSGITHADNPVVLSDIFLRIGGARNVHTETDTAMVINSDNTIGDNFWIWRADHSLGVAWDDEYENGKVSNYGNPSRTGLQVNGDSVKCYALMVEHFKGYQTYWKGENGLTVMYQCETPYRVPSQDEYKSHDGTKNGYSGYKVEDGVQRHRAYGLGVYLVQMGSPFNIESAIEVPSNHGIEMTHMVTCSFSASGGSTISHVVNDAGGAVGHGKSFRQLVSKYPIS